MARENKTKFAVLGLLSWQPMSGYDIRRVYRNSFGNFWSESYGQIYPILAQLEKEGFATSREERTPGRPEKHVYEITPAGRAALLAWLEQPTDPFHHRTEILLKVMHGFQAPPEVTLEQVRRFRDEHLALLETHAEIENALAQRRGRGYDHALPYWFLSVRFGELISEACLRWCDEATDIISGLEVAQAKEHTP